MKEINILSIGWRSHWLAQNFAMKGFDVHLYELTDHIDFSHEEDLDGPFPLHVGSGVPVEFLNLTQKNQSFELLKDGFCMSSPDGNLSSQSGTYESALESMREKFFSRTKHENNFWFDDFLKSFSKAKFKKSSLWQMEEDSFETKGNLFLRRSGSFDYDESLSSLSSNGVKVYKVLESDVKGLMSLIKKESDRWVIGMTVSEIKLLTSSRVENLEESYGWHRKRFIYEGEFLESLPIWSVHVSSSFKPWKESNFYILIKGKNSGKVDLWSLEQIYDDQKIIKSFDQASVFLDKMFPYVNFLPMKEGAMEGPLKTFFPVSNRYTELNDRLYNWNSPREWRGYSSQLMYEYQSRLLKHFDARLEAQR